MHRFKMGDRVVIAHRITGVKGFTWFSGLSLGEYGVIEKIIEDDGYHIHLENGNNHFYIDPILESDNRQGIFEEEEELCIENSK